MKKDKLLALSASKSMSALAPIPQSKYANCTVMGGSESAIWAWDMLWYAGQQNYVKMKILDTIRIDHGSISSWLFTMTVDGAVKSRKKSSWNLPAVFDKCRDRDEVVQTPDTALKAHYVQFKEGSTKPDDMEWQSTKKGQLSSEIFDEDNSSPRALVCYNRIEGSHSYAEISLEVNVNSKAVVSEKPKVSTHTLYTGHSLTNPEDRWMDKKEDVSAFPPKRLVCKNQQICMTTEAYVKDLRKLLEERSKCKIVKLIVMVVLEGVDEGEKVIWLHHVKQIILANRATHSGPGLGLDDDGDAYDVDYQQDRFERSSNATSAVTSSTTAYLKRQSTPCSGDFCDCPMDEEGVKAALDMAPDASFKQELQRARARNKIDNPNSSGDSPIKDSDGNALESAYADSTRGETHTGALDNGMKKKVNRAVPMKSIALCRKEAETWELTGRSGHYDGASMSWGANVFDWWFGVGKNLAQHRNSGATVPISSAHNIGKSILGMKPINEESEDAIRKQQQQPEEEEYGTLGDLANAKVDPITGAPLAASKNNHHRSDSSVNSGFGSVGGKSSSSKNVLYDLDGDNSYTGKVGRSVGQMSWYYSEAKVCQTCYQTYRDIDRRREAMQAKQMKALKKKQQLTGHEQAEYDKHIEQKIFDQRRMASRLAVPSLREEGVEYRRSGTSPADINAAKNARRKIVGAPKGVLPPLPWQLRDQENATSYENNKFSTTIVRNIRTKAQGMARAVQQDKLMERVDAKAQKREKMMTGGMLDEHSQMLDEGSLMQSFYTETQDQWQEYTGQSRMEAEIRATQKPRKVTGGLGENRFKGKSRNFDTKKLMHGWQRDAEELAAKVRGRGAEQVSGHGQFKPDAKERRRMEAAERAAQKLGYGGGGGGGGGGGAQSKATYGDENRSNGAHTHNSPSRSPTQKQTRFFPDESIDAGGINGLQQGSMVSQLTMDASMANGYGNAPNQGQGNYNGGGGGKGSHKQRGMDTSQASLEGLDDEDWIQAIMVKGKGDVPVSDLLDANGSIISQSSKKSALSRGDRNGARTPKGSLRVSFDGGGNAAAAASSGVSPKRGSYRPAAAGDDDDDDDDDDGEIGWSPFVVPMDQ